MSKRFGFLFPGQGAQFLGMGRDFYESFPLAKETFEEANDLLSLNLTQVIFEGPQEKLTETAMAQSALFVTSLAMLKVVQKQFPQVVPVLTAGLSLGEYTALTASGRLSFQEALPLVYFRGQCMQKACEQNKGTMAAIMGLETAVVEEMVRDLNLPNDLWIANYNAPTQIVISGTLKGVEAGMEAAKARGAKRAIPLQVQGAFRSGLMEPAKRALEARLLALQLKESPIDLIMNVTGSAVKESERIKQLLIDQVTSSVKWTQSMQFVGDKVDALIEIGAGKVLAGLNRQIGITPPTYNVGKVADLETLATL